VVAVGVANAATGQADHAEDDHDDEPDERTRDEGERIQKSISQCS